MFHRSRDAYFVFLHNMQKRKILKLIFSWPVDCGILRKLFPQWQYWLVVFYFEAETKAHLSDLVNPREMMDKYFYLERSLNNLCAIVCIKWTERRTHIHNYETQQRKRKYWQKLCIRLQWEVQVAVLQVFPSQNTLWVTHFDCSYFCFELLLLCNIYSRTNTQFSLIIMLNYSNGCTNENVDRFCIVLRKQTKLIVDISSPSSMHCIYGGSN